MRKRRLYWTLQVLGWSLYALINIATLSADPLGHGPESIRIQQIEVLIHTPILFLFSHIILRKVIIRLNWIQKDISKIIPKSLGLIAALALSVNLLANLFYYTFQEIKITSNFLTEFFFLTFAFIILYIIWCSLYFLYHYLESNNKSLKYEAAMNEMHLNQLKSQLNPHFIFNALNSVRALIDEEPGKAKIAITQLSNILRNSLIMDKKRVITFNEELNTVKDYLALESVRFEERLKVKYSIDEASEKFEIPPMMIQTLVENAIKHGVSSLLKGGIVELMTHVNNSVLEIKIKNSGQLVRGKRQNKGQSGYGIANTKERLKLIYGDEAAFRIYNENDKFVVTEVKIPQRI